MSQELTHIRVLPWHNQALVYERKFRHAKNEHGGHPVWLRNSSYRTLDTRLLDPEFVPWRLIQPKQPEESAFACTHRTLSTFFYRHQCLLLIAQLFCMREAASHLGGRGEAGLTGVARSSGRSPPAFILGLISLSVIRSSFIPSCLTGLQRVVRAIGVS